jgi:hypothetical protein
MKAQTQIKKEGTIRAIVTPGALRLVQLEQVRDLY